MGRIRLVLQRTHGVRDLGWRGRTLSLQYEQAGGELLDAGLHTVGNRRIQAQAPFFVPRQLLGIGIDAGEDLLGAQRMEHGTQRIVERQGVGMAAARGQRQHQLARQTILRQQIEEGFQQPCIRGLVDGRGDHDGVGVGHGAHGAGDCRIVVVGQQQGTRRQVAHMQLGVAVALQHQLFADMQQQAAGTRWELRATAQ
ncbi:hypothetical protein D3C72_1570200 [compost metagenome]